MSQREAAERWHVSRATMQRAIKSGKLSATRSEAKEWQIDPAEMLRVFGPARSRPAEPHEPPREPTSIVSEGPDLKAEVARLQLELAWKDQLMQQQRSQIEDLRTAMRLLSHQTAPWYKRIFGG